MSTHTIRSRYVPTFLPRYNRLASRGEDLRIISSWLGYLPSHATSLDEVYISLSVKNEKAFQVLTVWN